MAPSLPHLHLEDEGRERAVVPHGDGRLAPVRVESDGVRPVQGRGQQPDHGVEQRLDPEVAQGGAAEAGGEGARQGGVAQRRPDLLRARLEPLEDPVRQGLVGLGDAEQQALAQGLHGLPGLRRAGLGLEQVAVLAAEADQGAVDQVDHRGLVGQGDGHRDGVGVKAPAYAGQGLSEIGARPVHLVDEKEGGEIEAGALAPDGLGLGLDAPNAVDDQDGAVEHPHAPLHLDGEVDVPRRVDDLDQVVAPVRLGDRRGDGDAVALLLGHVVHVGGAVVDLADLVQGAGVEEDAFGQGRLAGVDVCGDADVPDLAECSLLCHPPPCSPLFARDPSRAGRVSRRTPALRRGGAGCRRRRRPRPPPGSLRAGSPSPRRTPRRGPGSGACAPPPRAGRRPSGEP